MKRIQTKGIVLKRVNYGEADRIITFITPSEGKISAIAKGVRKAKSKLAGGIELFSICDLSLIEGRGNLATVVSTRLETHFEKIISSYEHMEVGYAATRLVGAFTDDDAPESYFNLLAQTYALLSSNCSAAVVACWFYLQLMKLHGALPDTLKDTDGDDLSASAKYAFSVEDARFFKSEMGVFGADEIKAWRVFLNAEAKQIRSFTGLDEPAQKSQKVLASFVEFQL